MNPELLKVDEALGKAQIENLERIRAERNNEEVKEKLDILRKHAQNPEKNLIPAILDAVKAYASVGEICNVLRDEFGEYTGS